LIVGFEFASGSIVSFHVLIFILPNFDLSIQYKSIVSMFLYNVNPKKIYLICVIYYS